VRALRRPDVAILAGILLLLILLFSDILFLGNGLYFRDIFRYHFPMKHVVREAMLSGEFPYWNPLISSGQPLAANPAYELFYPPQWLVLLPGYVLGFQLHILVHFAIAAAGMFLFLRSLDISLEAALFGSVSFSLGGFLLGLVNVLPFFFAVSWLPWIVLFARRYIRTGRGLLMACVTLAMQGLIGEPMTLMQTWLILGGYAVYAANGARASSLKRTAAILAGGTALAAIQLLPAIDHVRDSVRARGFTYDTVTQWSMPPLRPLELFLPHLFGRVSENGLLFWGGAAYPRAGAPFVLSVYCGVLVAIFFVAGLLMRRRVMRFAAAGAGLSLLLALGSHTPLFRLLYAAGVRSLRFPEKFLITTIFIAIVVAALAFDAFVRGDDRVKRHAFRIACAVAAILLVLTLFSRLDVYAAAFASVWSTTDAIHVINSQRDLLRALGFAVLAVALLWAGRSRITPAWRIGALLFVLLDLIPFSFELLPRMPREYFSPPPAASGLDGPLFHEADWYLSPTRRKYFGQGKNTAWVVRNGLFPMTPAAWGVPTVLNRDYDETSLIPTGELIATMQAWREKQRFDWSQPFIAMSSARYRAAFRPFEEEMTRVGGNFANVQPVEFVRASDASRFTFPRRLVQVKSRTDVLTMLETNVMRQRAALVETFPFIPSDAVATRVLETNNRVEIDVAASGDAFLAAAITRHKYWSATVDGEPVAIVPTNIAYSGIEIPQGRHSVVMRYRNPLIGAGAALSAAALLMLIFAARRYRTADA
jgi:hypothetical protein